MEQYTVTLKTTERGWPGHFICASRCNFRRNTLVEYLSRKIVVSTVGYLVVNDKVETVGHNRYYETMVFESDYKDTEFYDIDVSRQIYIGSPWSIDAPYKDNEANAMHDTAVKEVCDKLLAGTLDMSKELED